MVHLKEETLSELLDGACVAGAEEHLGSCPVCRGELEALRRLRSELRELPELDAPPELWSRIEARLPVAGRSGRWRLGWPGRTAMQAAAMAATFVIGVGLGRMFGPGDQAGPSSQVVSERAAATSLADAMAEVRRLGAQYDAALRNLEQLAAQEGAPTPSLAEQRLASLDALVEASRTALSVEPADPVLNSYLFAALEERDAVLRQIRAQQESGSEVFWR